MEPTGSQHRPPRTWVDIDLARIEANIAAIERMLPAGAGILMPVKANGYGHGLVEVSSAARRAGVWGLGVAALDEVDTLRRAGDVGPIVCLMPLLPEEARRAVALDTIVSITSDDQAIALSEAAMARSTTTRVHLDVDTGMGRSGVWARDAVGLGERVAKLPGLEVDGIFTHFASADESDRAFTEAQIDRFDAILSELSERGVEPRHIHAANSAAALRFRRSTRALVRPGIAVYGTTEEIAPDTDVDGREAIDRAAFTPALSWHARVVAVKELRAGETVSYHRTYTAQRRERIALLGVGYGDGWPFSLSGRGRVLLRGRSVPIRGSVCMDLTMVDATPFPDLAVGETATLIGQQDGAIQSVAEVGRDAGLMSYAVFTAISSRVPRRYANGGSDET